MYEKEYEKFLILLRLSLKFKFILIVIFVSIEKNVLFKVNKVKNNNNT